MLPYLRLEMQRDADRGFGDVSLVAIPAPGYYVSIINSAFVLLFPNVRLNAASVVHRQPVPVPPYQEV